MVAAVGVALTAVAAQDAARPLTFDVLSVKESTGPGLRRLEWTPGRFIALGSPFVGLVNMAYGGGAPVRLEGADALRLSMWDIEGTSVNVPPSVQPTPAAAEPSNLPSLVTALQEQLGLRLESMRVPLDYHVVERVERPSSN